MALLAACCVAAFMAAASAHEGGSSSSYGCQHAPQSAMAFCNPTLPIAARIDDLMRRLHTDEKLNFLWTGNNNISRLGIGSYSWWTEMLHGVFGGFFAPGGTPPGPPGSAKPTIFPNGIGLAASFDPEIVEAVSSVISTEARALNNAVQLYYNGSSVESGGFQGLNGYAPNCNLYRDPRWGRAQETFGESPRHVAELCSAFIRGLQGNNSQFLKIAATVKHYSFYSGPECDGHSFCSGLQCGGCKEFPGIGRGNFNAQVDAQDAFQTYLLPFESAVAPAGEGGGGAAALMNSFSHVNNIAMVENEYLMQTVLRGQFGFEGMVVTDWGAIGNYQGPDKYFGIKNGNKPLPDADQPLPAAFRFGFINESTVDTSVRRVLTTMFRVGRFDSESANPYRRIPVTAIGAPAHRALARQAAAEAVILLQNSGELLPLKVEHVTGIALIGPAAGDNAVAEEEAQAGGSTQDAQTLLNYCGDYSSCGNCPANHTVTVAAGIRNYLRAAGSQIPLFVAQGCELNSSNTSGFAVALDAARRKEVSHIVLVVGLSGSLEGEGNDLLPSRFPLGPAEKAGFELPGVQQQLVDQVAALGKPTVLIVIGGGSISVAPNSAIGAKLHALYPGVEAGNGIADLIFGVVSPASRLPMTVPHSSNELPPYLNYSMVGEPFGRTHAWLRGEGSEPAHEYASGLSYSKFVYSKLRVSRRTADDDADADVEISVTVQNVGRGGNSWSKPTDEVVLVFATWSNISESFDGRVPVRQLVGFARLRQLAPQEVRQWTTTIPQNRYALVTSSGVSSLPSRGLVTFHVGGHMPTAASDAAAGTRCLNATLDFSFQKGSR